MKKTRSRQYGTRGLAALVIAVSIAASMAGCEAPSHEAKEIVVKPIVVEASPVTTQRFVDSIEVSAVIEPSHEVHVAAEAAGRVLKAPLVEGGPVKKRDLIVRIDAKVDNARLNVLANQVASARREYERTKLLASEGLATPQQLDQAESAVSSSRLNLAQGKVGVGKTTVRSPMSGTVARKYVEEGEFVAPGAPLAHIVDIQSVVIEASVPESAIGFVAKGTKAEIYVPALERRFTGVVTRRAVVATPKTRTFPVQITVPNDSETLLPGMRARVIVVRKTYEDVVTIGRDAVLQGYAASEVIVVDDSEKGKTRGSVRRIELGPSKGNEVVVISGLAAGERIVTKGHRGLVDGGAIRVVDSPKDDAAKKKASPPASKKKADPPTSAKKGAGTAKTAATSERTGTDGAGASL